MMPSSAARRTSRPVTGVALTTCLGPGLVLDQLAVVAVWIEECGDHPAPLFLAIFADEGYALLLQPLLLRLQVIDEEVDEHAMRLRRRTLRLAVAVDCQNGSAGAEGAVAHVRLLRQAHRFGIERLQFVCLLAGDVNHKAVDLHP